MRKRWRKLEARVWSGLVEWQTRDVSDSKRGHETREWMESIRLLSGLTDVVMSDVEMPLV